MSKCNSFNLSQSPSLVCSLKATRSNVFWASVSRRHLESSRTLIDDNDFNELSTKVVQFDFENKSKSENNWWRTVRRC